MQQYNSVKTLLLSGEQKNMNISNSEKLLSFYIKYKMVNVDTYSSGYRWTVNLDQYYQLSTLPEMIDLIMTKYKPTGIQMIPTSVNDNAVDIFLIMITIPIENN